MIKNNISIKGIGMLVILTICIMGFSSISNASNENIFTFANSGITASDTSGSGYKIEGTSLTINEAGTYTITGSCSEGSVKVKKETTGVTLILKDLTLSSTTTAPISLNKSTETTIQVVGTVTLTDKEDASTEDTNEDFEGACIKVKSGASLNIKGNGTLNADGTNCKNGIKGGATSQIVIDGSVTFNINAVNNGLAADGSMIINGGTFNVNAEDAIKCDYDDDDTESIGDLTINGGTFNIKATSDGIRANGKLEINGGKFDITAGEGLEGTYVLINNGTINLNATDDGINASNKSSRYPIKAEINGGSITINMGRGDTDAIDSNGELIITGGTINITAQSAFDYDGKVTFTGGTVIVNGQKITTISGSMMGGGMHGGRNQNGNQMQGGFDNQNRNQMIGNDIPSGDFERQNGQQMMPPELDIQKGQMNQQMAPFGDKKWSKASEWAVEELDKANERGLIPQSFTNNDLTTNITREEFAHIIIKLYEAITGQKVSNVINNPFTDTNDTEVLKAYSLGITNGTSSSTFTPNNLITREEMATMFTRAIDKAGVDISNLEQTSKYDDDSEMHDWGRNSIYFMSNLGIIKGMGNNVFGVNGTATKEQAILLSERSAERFSR